MIAPHVRLAEIKRRWALGRTGERDLEMERQDYLDVTSLVDMLEEAWRMRYEIDTDRTGPSVARIYRDDALIWTGRDFSADARA